MLKGHPEWDLTSTAVSVDTLGNLSEDAYGRYCSAYGYDVRSWEDYPTMRAIRELRMTSFSLQAADNAQKFTSTRCTASRASAAKPDHAPGAGSP